MGKFRARVNFLENFQLLFFGFSILFEENLLIYYIINFLKDFQFLFFDFAEDSLYLLFSIIVD